MIYLHADIAQVNRSEWRGWLRELDLDFYGSTQAIAEHNAYRLAEEAEGYKSFSIIFLPS